MAKFRSRDNYAQVYASEKQGFNLGLDGKIFLKRELTRGVFNPPTIGTQGFSEGDTGASTDITAHATPATLKIQLGYPTGAGAIVTASIPVAGLNTGNLIAAALESAINTALAADGQDGRVWVEFDTDHYVVWHQSTGDEATVVITDGVTNNIADDLNLGVANGGTESAGTDDQDFLLYTTGGFTFNQPVESNLHRSGRFHSGIIRKKKVCEFDFDTYINMQGNAGDSLDTAVMLLLESVLGTKVVTSGQYIDFVQGLPVIYMTACKVSTIFGEYYTGGYTRQATLNFPGDGPATVKYQGRAADASIAGIAQLNGAVVSSANVVVNNNESERFSSGGRVMLVDTDGRTITAGQDGSLYLTADPNDNTNTLVLNTPVSAADDSYIVPWDPGAVGQTARDNIYTDLVGSFKLSQSDSAVDVTNIQLSVNNDHVDLDNRFGADGNRGFVAGNRCTMELSVTFDLSNETFGKVVRTRQFAGFDPQVILGAVGSGRYLDITGPKWIPAVPALEVPENGTTPTTLVGNLFESAPGAKNPIRLRFG